MRRFNTRLVGVVFVLSLAVAGCSSSLTDERLDSASVEGPGPTEVKAGISDEQTALIDLWSLDTSWTPVEGASDYQLQYRQSPGVNEDWGSWFTVTSQSDKNPAVVKGTSYRDQMLGYDKILQYRVRAVYSGKEVSEWTESNRVLIPEGNILYEVEGTSPTARLTFTTPTGSQQGEYYVPLKCSSEEPASAPGRESGFLFASSTMRPYLSATVVQHGTVTCRISIKGVVVSENTASGRGATATCTG